MEAKYENLNAYFFIKKQIWEKYFPTAFHVNERYIISIIHVKVSLSSPYTKLMYATETL
jgi:hypothetical protein